MEAQQAVLGVFAGVGAGLLLAGGQPGLGLAGFGVGVGHDAVPCLAAAAGWGGFCRLIRADYSWFRAAVMRRQVSLAQQRRQ